MAKANSEKALGAVAQLSKANGNGNGNGTSTGTGNGNGNGSSTQGKTSKSSSSAKAIDSGTGGRSVADIQADIDALVGDKKGGITGNPFTSLNPFINSQLEGDRAKFDALQAELAEAGGPDNRPLTEQVPESPDVEGTLRPFGEDAIAAQEQADLGEFEAAKEDKELADTRADDIQSDVTGIEEDTKAAEEDLAANQERIQADIEQQKEELQEIPGAIKEEFEDLRADFDAEASLAFDRIDSQREEALGKVMEGQGQALQAAVSGIQGNINNQIAQIQANPNLTEGQKQSMIAQTKMQGSMNIGPAVGQTVLQFNQLAADVGTKFGAITGQIQTQVLSGQERLAGLQGEAFSQAQVQVGQMTNQLLELDANSSVAFSNAQNQLIATRSQAQMAGNDALVRLLPEQATPYADFTASANARLQFESDIMDKQFVRDLQSFSVEAQVALIESMKGGPLENTLMGALQGFKDGGLVGLLLGGAGALFGNLSGNSTS